MLLWSLLVINRRLNCTAFKSAALQTFCPHVQKRHSIWGRYFPRGQHPHNLMAICHTKPFTMVLSHWAPLSPYGLCQPSSTVENLIPYATGSLPLIGFSHQHGFRAMIGCSSQGPLRLSYSVVSAGVFFNGQKQLPTPQRASRDVQQPWSGGNLWLSGDGINISTSAIVVMFLHWQISINCESELP